MDGYGTGKQHIGKVIRAPSLKRGRPDERITDVIKLERVLGVTVSSNAVLDSDPNTETVAYPAGCTVVLFNTKTGHQSHIISNSRKTITSLAFSSCGRYLVTGECGHQPAVRVWSLQSDPQPGPPGVAPQVQQVAEFLSHKYGISCVAFSPTSKYVVSIGTQHDMIVNVWDWKNNIKVASNKVSTKVKALAFAENGSYFVTVGNRHVKFWFLEYGKAKYKEAVPLMGRSAILGEQRNNYFCDVACGKGQCGDSTYAITRSGLLCEFNNRRLLDKWVELRTSSANCIAVGETYIFVGCAEGIVRCFDPTTLRFVTTLPRTHYLGVDVSQGLNITHMSSPRPEAKYPDTVAITFDENSKKLTCIYNDHSIYVWDVHNIRRVGKSHSFLYHSACIWGVEMAPPNCPLPPGSFLTCSSDDTIRVWTLDKLNEKNGRGMYQRNIYSNELLKVVYIDNEMTYLKDLDLSTVNGTTSNDKPDTSYDGRNGVRSIRLSPDGKNLASGDRAGNIRIHETKGMMEECKIEAHDAEVLCLEYTQPETENKFLASASRDRLIHVFDVNDGYNFQQTLDDHSSSITAVRFLNQHGNLQMVSCGADKSLIFRSLGESPEGTPQFIRGHNATGKTTLYDMEVDSGQKHVLTACQDRNVRIYNAGTGKHTRIFKGSTGDDGTLIKVTLDRSGIYLATSCTDKSLSVYDYYTGECMATMCGHSELATGLRFTNDCRRLISASGDGCIFVWRVPHDMVVTMHARLSQQAMRQGKTLDNEIFTDSSNVDFYDPNSNNVENDYRFSVGALPLWAKKHISDDTSPPPSLTRGVAAPKGRWAQRAERSGVGMKSIYTDSIISFPSLHDRRGDSDEKDSSLDSGTETRQYTELHREQKTATKQVTISSVNSSRRNILTDDSAMGGSVRDTDIESTAHDGDIDSDQEYRLQPLYYLSHPDSASGSEFTVTNMDADELRRSQRRSKRANLPAISIQPTSISGSQDSDDDDDEASTPSGENTDRNPMSILSVSLESLDQIVNREKYFQSAFESLSGAELEANSPANKSSISSQYLTRTTNGSISSRNIAVINAARQTKNDGEASKKREELAKIIASTRQKLQSIGYTSPLKYSQSIHDLSHIPERDKWNSPNNHKQENDHLPPLPTSFSLPSNLQLCGCYMRDIAKNINLPLANCSSVIGNSTTPSSSNDELVGGCVKLSDLNKIPSQKHPPPRPRKLHLTKYKLNKSLPVSPVNEERSFSDYVPQKSDQNEWTSSTRRSFSYFLDFDRKTAAASSSSADASFRQICDDIEKFSHDFNEKNNRIDREFPTTIPQPPSREAEDDGSFSSDSLEDCSFNSTQNRRSKKYRVPRRCVSNNEIHRYLTESHANYDTIPKSESFYLNPSNKNSQDSILSEDDGQDEFGGNRTKSYCNSLESVLSCESDCKSAPLEILFTSYKKPSDVVPQTVADKQQQDNVEFGSRLKTSQTQTDFETPEELVAKKYCTTSTDFQRKLLKFETCIAQNENFNVRRSLKETKRRGVAFFVENEQQQRKTKKETNPQVAEAATKKKNNRSSMYIPTLETKNKQYESRYCNVLNNRPETNHETHETVAVPHQKNNNRNNTINNENVFVLTEKNTKVHETSSLDRHLFTKNLLESDRIAHKPPKGMRRNSSRSRKGRTTTTTYEYIRKDDFVKKMNNVQNSKNNENHNHQQQIDSFEFSYKEKNVERECQNGNNATRHEETKILHELYDSLDKIDLGATTKMDYDSLEVNINKNRGNNNEETAMLDSLEYGSRNVWRKNDSEKDAQSDDSGFSVASLDYPSLEFAMENIKILNEIQRKINRINTLVDVFKRNMCSGKVRALSQMYETLTMTNSQSYYNDLFKGFGTKCHRRRNLSLPNFIERRLSSFATSPAVAAGSSGIAFVASSSVAVSEGTKKGCKRLNVDRPPPSPPPQLEEEPDLKLKQQVHHLDVDDSSSPDSGLRRACSLSDLSMQGPVVQKRKIEQVSGKLTKLPTAVSPAATTITVPRPNSRYSKNMQQQMITRSSSTGVLNQSDSENEGGKKKNFQSRLMKPTISSQNKVSTNKNTTMRKRQSYSVMNLSTVGNEDSSSEENEKISPSKPMVPPRTRTSMMVNENGQGSIVPPRRLNKEKNKNIRNNVAYERKKSVDLDTTLTNEENNVDVSTVQLSTQLCNEVAFQLTKAANNVMELYERLTDVDSSNNEQLPLGQKTDMVKNLEMSIGRTLKMLHDLTLEKLKQNKDGLDLHRNNTVKKLNELVCQPVPNNQNMVVNMMQQYSDILLSIMQDTKFE